MNAMIAWWARNGVAANLLMVGVLLAGVLGFLRLDREVFPSVRPSEVQVIVPWPGAAPQEVEEQVVMRIEEALTELEGIAHLGAIAQEGLATISIEAEPRVDIGQFIDEIKRRVDTISGFPADIERPVVARPQSRDEALRLAVHGELGERELKRIAEDLRDQVARLPGVSLVMLFGVRNEEVSVELSAEAMRRYGLSFDEVARAIRASSVNASAGTVRTEGGDIQLRARSLADNAVEFESLVVRESASGAVVRLGDVARVVDGFEDNEILATLNGTPAVLLQVLNTEHMDVVQISDSVREWLPRARAALPAGVELTLWFDSADMYRSRMQTLTNSALSGLVLVFAVLMLTLRPRVALWVTVGIATSYAGACALLPAFDVSINIMSTFAFMLVLGVMVDDAIVIGESIHDEGGPHGGGLAAAVRGTQAVAKPVLFGVLTMAVAFMPWFFISGEEAQITRQISIVIVLSLLFSLVDAFLVLPAHLSALGPRRDRNRFARLQHRVELALTAFARGAYRRHLERVVRRHYLTASVFLALFMLGIGAVSAGWLRFSFMPEIEGDQIIVEIALPEGAPYSRALEILAQLQRAERDLVEEVNALGEGQLVESWYTRSRRDSVIAIVKLVPPEVRALTAKEAAGRLRELVGEIPDAEAITVQHSMNFQQPELQYQLSHTDPEVLKRAVHSLQERLAQYDTVYDLRNNLRDATEELRFRLLPGAERMGITLAEVTRQVRQAYFGQEVQRLPRDGGDVKVMVRFPSESRSNLHSLATLRITTADGREVPLLAVAEVEYHPGVQKIERRERQRAVVVSAELREEVRHRIQGDLDTAFLPGWRAEYPGISLRAVGEAEGESEFLQEVASLYAIALFLMYALIAVAFRSYWQPLIIMTAIPFGYLGAVLGHLAYDMPMSLFSYFGIGAASGVVINDNLVLMDRIATLRERGMAAVDAVLEAGVTRFRPILLTSVTTFIGLLPAMTDASIEAQFLQPTTIALAWGVATATFVTLLLTPALYLVGEDLRSLPGRVPARALAPPAAAREGAGG